jgi:hypothetical protein
VMWPLQRDCDEFYGNPRGPKNPTVVNPKWLIEHMGWVTPPFKMFYDGRPVTRFQLHEKCVDSMNRVLEDIWNRAERSQDLIHLWGADVFGGSYNYRLKRGQSTLSMHSYGCAIDLDPTNNGFNSRVHKFFSASPVVQAFKAEGWVWGGDWSSPDAMHFQAARVR